MNNQSIVWVLVAFGAYLIGMILIGAVYARKTNSTEDYFLGGRGLNGWVAALSAQASDMSGWLLMGLPGAIYAAGIGECWIAVGLFIGTVFNWAAISARLRRYTIEANNSLTLPAYFENRFHDKSKILLTASSIFIVIFFLVYTASALAAGGKLFNVVFGLDYQVALTIGAIVILIYTFLGGFMAVCVTDFIQGLLMLAGLFIVPVLALAFISPSNLVAVIGSTQPAGGAPSFFNMMESGGNRIGIISILSSLGWGLGYCGMPHILTRFMALSSEKELKKSRVIGIVWAAISLGFACMVGVIGRAYLYPVVLGADGAGSAENVFIQVILKVFTNDLTVPFLGGVFLCGILAAIMSTADSQLLVTAASVSEDIYKGVLKPEAKDSHVLAISRVTVILVAVLAYFIALNPDNSIMGLVSNAWAGFGSAFGPVVLLSLFWRRSNRTGAVAGMLCGGMTVLIWDYLPLIGGRTPANATGLYSLVVGFVAGILAMVIGSLCTKEPSEEILREFDKVRG